MGNMSEEDKSAVEDMRKKGWPNTTNRVMLQHGINLGWIGIWSIVMCFFVHYPPRMLWLMTMPIYCFDFGYFIAIDIPHLGGKMGQAQTFICSIGILCASIITKNTYESVSDAEFGFTAFMPIFFILIAFLLMVKHFIAGRSGGAKAQPKADPRDEDL